MFWNEGIIHHEDVLYFSFRILKENPILLEFLSSRFPYIFLDEFQDTNPIQTQIVKWFASAESLIGVIGDSAQSIYKFQDANRADFLNFSLSGIQDYVIAGNRRSTEKIVAFLNHVRGGDIVQNCDRGQAGQPVSLLVAPSILPSALPEFVRTLLGHREANSALTVLARTNNEVAKLRSPTPFNDKSWENLNTSNYKREQFFRHIIQAIEYAYHGRFETAVTEMIRIFRARGGRLQDPFRSTCPDIPPILKRGYAVALVEHLLSCRPTLLQQSAFALYQLVSTWFSSAQNNLTLVAIAGGFKAVAEATNFADLAKTVILSEETRSFRTIHNSKGCEFDAVMLYLSDESDLERLLSANINEESDETRILYVATSRAKNHLFISVPSLSLVNKAIVDQLEISVTPL